MASDVEMYEGTGRLSVTPDLHLSPPPLSVSATTSRRSSHDGAHGISISNGVHVGSSISIPVLVHSPSPAPSTSGGTAATTSGPAGAAAPAAASSSTTTNTKPSSGSNTKPGSSVKPRSKAVKARSPSPSPPPPPPVVPLQTIRLDIRLGGPSNYEVDISRQAKDTGQRPPTPPPVVKKVADSSDSEDDEDDKPKEDGESKPKRKKRKNVGSEYYDTSDPFIDDSELALDERQFFAQTKQQGFYVSSGEVALMKDKTPKKPKSKKISFASGLHPSANLTAQTGSASLPALAAPGTRDAPIPVDDGTIHTLPNGTTLVKPDLSYVPGADPIHAGQKRKRTSTSVATEGGKRKKIVDESVFHPDLQAAIRDLKDLIAKENWEQKGKFPATLKPALGKIALLAIRLDEYDDDFFSLMPTMFPYNKFTMTKLIKRTVFTDHLKLLVDRQDVLLEQLAELAKAGFDKAKDEWEKSVVAWDKRQEKLRTDTADASAGGTGTGSAGPTRQPTEEMDVDGHPPATQGGDGAEGGSKDGKDKDSNQHPPAKRYRMTEQMKAIIWELVLLSNECCRLENEKNSLEGSVIQLSDQGLRKVLYQKIVSAYPDGWMSSGQISRDVSAMKKKLEREAAENADDD